MPLLERVCTQLLCCPLFLLVVVTSGNSEFSISILNDELRLFPLLSAMSIGRKSLKTSICHFTWAWHTIVMGTGAVSALASRFHFGEGSEVLKIITLLFFFLNLCFFTLICGATVARYWIFPELWPAMLGHSTQSLFIGTFPMGAATLINIALVANQSYSFAGPGFLYTLMMQQEHSLHQMSALWLLPFVTLIVASSTGGLLAATLKSHPMYAAVTTAVSFTIPIMGFSPALMIITLYLMCLIIHGPPVANLILSSFIILGPLGQGRFSMLLNSQNLTDLWLPGSLSAEAIESKTVPFSVAYWGTIFPNSVFTLLTVELGSVLDSPVVNYLGTIFSVMVLLLWIFVFVKMTPAIWNTSVFNSPCAAKLDEVTLVSSEGRGEP
ncbi:voltage-dependent anion channel-domain-containing protein [Mycena sp. CBHHK59/15]|nr:voltage-dependent anion channel-domain-containing protein [Mycena sp. CBHHK59/15]